MTSLPGLSAAPNFNTNTKLTGLSAAPNFDVNGGIGLRSILITAGSRTRFAALSSAPKCSGGSYTFRPKLAIDSGCVLDYVTDNPSDLSALDESRGLPILTSSGQVTRADGIGVTHFQTIVINTNDPSVRKSILVSTGWDGATLMKNSKQPLLGSAWLSKSGLIGIQDHLRPRCELRGLPGWEVPVTFADNLWYLDMCVFTPGCSDLNCESCVKVREAPCWDCLQDHHSCAGGCCGATSCGFINGVMSLNSKVRHSSSVSFEDAEESDLHGFSDHIKLNRLVRRQAHAYRRRRYVRVQRRALEVRESPEGDRQSVLSLGGATDAKPCGPACGCGGVFGASSREGKESVLSSTTFPTENQAKCRFHITASLLHGELVNKVLANGQFNIADLHEQESRKQAQKDMGVTTRPSRHRIEYREVKNLAPLLTWHHRLGCASTRTVKATSACVKGMGLSDQIECSCITCLENSNLRPNLSKITEPRDHENADTAFTKCNMDWKGPVTESHQGHKWFLVVVCKKFDLVWHKTGKSKSQAPKFIREFFEFCASKGLKVKLISSDSDSTFLSKDFRAVTLEFSVDQRFYVRAHRNQHAERAILVGLKRANAILIHALMADIMWCEAISFAYYIWNRLVNVDHHDPAYRQKPRLECAFGEKVDFSLWKVPFCTCFPIDHSSRYGQFKSRVLPGDWINLGLDSKVAAWRIMDLRTKEIRVHWHLWFLETMDHRKDALSRFDRHYLHGLERMSNGKIKTILTKRERIALRLRQAYRNPEHQQPTETFTVGDDTILEFKGIDDTGNVPESTMEKPGVDYLMEHVQLESENEQSDSEEAEAEPQSDGPNSSSTSAGSNISNKNEKRSGPAKVDPPSTDSDHELQGQFWQKQVYDQEPTDPFNVDTNADDSSLTDGLEEEYQDLVAVKELNELPSKSDQEIREAEKNNVESQVAFEDVDPDGTPYDEFIASNPSIQEQTSDAAYKKADSVDLNTLQQHLEHRRSGKFKPASITESEHDAVKDSFKRGVPIRWLIDFNIKRKKSHGAFQKYWNNGATATLAEAKKRGMTLGDAINDYKRGFFEIKTSYLDVNAALKEVFSTVLLEEPELSSAQIAASVHKSSGAPIDPPLKSLTRTLLDAPRFNPSTAVVLRNMALSSYRNEHFDGCGGVILSFDDKSMRYRVHLKDPIDQRKIVYVRDLHLDRMETVTSVNHRAPPNELIEVLRDKGRSQKLKEEAQVLSIMHERIHLMQQDLADPEDLTTEKLYEVMALGYQTAMAKAFEVECPSSFKRAVKGKDKDCWIKSILKEIKALEDMETWTVVHRSQAKREGKNIMKSGFVFRVKSDEDGFIKDFEEGGYKSRFVCKGYSEVYGEDFWNVRSGVVDYSSARILIALAAAECAELWTYDVKNAFVATKVPEGEEFYCEAPEDTENNDLFKGKFIMEDGTTGVLRCSRCLYGSKNSPRRFWQKLEKALRKGGFKPLIQDQCVLVCDRRSVGGGILRCALWVDDILLTTENEKDKLWFDEFFRDEFTLASDSGVEPAKHYLGMKVSRDRDAKTITLSCPALVDNLVNDLVAAGHLAADAGTRSHPMVGSSKMEPIGPDETALTEKDYPYRMVVGVCLHLSRTVRPDIALAVSELSRYVQQPGQEHKRAANWLACYLKGTRDLGITYHGNLPSKEINKLISYSDADWAGDSTSRKSRSGYTLQINGGPVEWYSKGQTIISTSSCMSETIAAVEAAKAIVCSRLFLFELGYKQPGSSRLFVDNEATVLNSNGYKQSKRSKHFQIRTELLRSYTQLGRIHVFKVDTNDNISDLHTKPLTGDKFLAMRDLMMGVKLLSNVLNLTTN